MRKPCVKCLLSEISPDTVYKEIREYIDSLDATEKADEADYKRRLDICRECDSMREGICALCGCFVEVRAIKKKNKCPFIPKKW